AAYSSVDGLGLFLGDCFLCSRPCNRQSEKAGAGGIDRRMTERRAPVRERRDVLLLCSFASLGSTLWPQNLLLAHQPHRGPLALHAFPGTKLVEAAVRAERCVGWLGSATMLANGAGFGFGVDFGFGRRWLNLSEMVVMFLNGEGG